jgi:hypothetical protein
VAGAQDKPNEAVEDRESVERLGGSAHVGEKAEEVEFCSVASGPGREQKDGKWGAGSGA